jgi:hypothetical protein
MKTYKGFNYRFDAQWGGVWIFFEENGQQFQDCFNLEAECKRTIDWFLAG